MTAFSLPTFQNQALWRQAMTHSSFTNEQPGGCGDHRCDHNERLEFLGDAILTFISGAYLYARYPERSEGELTLIRAALVEQSQLCRFAQALGLGEHLRLGKGADQEGGRKRARLLCSAFEALIGAYFLDTECNVKAVSDYVLPMFNTVVESAIQQSIDPKSRFQEWAHGTLGATPKYAVTNSSGPDHAKNFAVEVRVAGKVYGEGQGHSKKEAEKAAAAAAIISLKEIINSSHPGPSHAPRD